MMVAVGTLINGNKNFSKIVFLTVKEIVRIIQFFKDLDYKVNKSKVAQSLATAFFLGFGSAASLLILPDLNNPALLLQNIISPAWLYMFFNVSFGAALSSSIGMYIRTVFDKPVTTITSTETVTITPPSDNKK